MSRSRMLVDAALLALLAAAALVVAADLQAVRPFVVLAAACLVPGGALLTLLGAGEALTALALAVGLSLAIEVVASLVLAWAGWWHPAALAAFLGAGSAVLLLVDLARARR